MPEDKCLQFEDCLSRGEEPEEVVREHIARCPRCAALAATEFKVAAVSTAPEDRVLGETLARVSEIATRRRARAERRRRIVPLLIGLGGYAIGAAGIAVSLLPNRGGTGIPTPESGALFTTPSLPPPSPATVGLVALAAGVWMAGLVAWARRREMEEEGGRQEG